ncbi:hypothetical protein [Ewingella americana]|uniref:Uncharacterized protein n=1 Tax=Ewingella americana TaxID=41202 RepID=A0A502GCD4_9GAMM|nr:hypothetical protein [Ewingella americana]TPG59927.1 hypothetical protein EAH77_15280 [Ewingella americana]
MTFLHNVLVAFFSLLSKVENFLTKNNISVEDLAKETPEQAIDQVKKAVVAEIVDAVVAEAETKVTSSAEQAVEEAIVK